ncbi:unnamed protein product [Protopolystoma xenopodis]|uniref:Uncharacterized protein n=1 Tax=Protopolystoma xenopodis TaxID=117903 RepID=A0A448XF15_9PLAT|nr:unnamed protein product [Protopolystoma xenopodis]
MNPGPTLRLASPAAPLRQSYCFIQRSPEDAPQSPWHYHLHACDCESLVRLTAVTGLRPDSSDLCACPRLSDPEGSSSLRQGRHADHLALLTGQ